MEQTIIISNINELVRIKAERIVYIISDGNYSTLTLHDRSEHVCTFNLSRMQKILETQLQKEASQFIRIGKSLIINKNYIYKINLSKQTLTLSDIKICGSFTLSASKEALKQLKNYLESDIEL